MASSFTIADLITDVASLTNSPAFSATTRITSTQVTYWLSQAARSYSALMRQRFPDDRELIQTAVISTVPNLRLASLPSDCGEVHSVVWQRGTNDYVLLESFSQGDLAVALESGQTWDSDVCVPRYRLAGQTIEFFPTPTTAESIELYYTTHLSTGGATVIAKLDFDKWITLDVAIRVCTAKSMGPRTAEFEQKKALLENDMLSRARARDVNKVTTIRDTRAERYFANQRKNFS